MSNPNRVEKGVAKMIVDGKEIDGTVVPYVAGKELFDVKVVMG